MCHGGPEAVQTKIASRLCRIEARIAYGPATNVDHNDVKQNESNIMRQFQISIYVSLVAITLSAPAILISTDACAAGCQGFRPTTCHKCDCNTFEVCKGGRNCHKETYCFWVKDHSCR